MKKKKGICAFFRGTWKAVKHTALCCHRGNKVAPEPSSVQPVAQQDPADPQPGPSGLGLELSMDLGPSGLKSMLIDVPDPDNLDFELTAVPGPPSVEMTRTTDPADPETSSVSDPSNFNLTPDSDPTSPEPLPEPGPSGLEPVVPQDLVELGASILDFSPHTDLVDSQPVYVSCKSNLEMKPDSDPDPDPEPEPLPGPSGLYEELTAVPGPSGFGPAVEYKECPAVKATVKSLGISLFRMVNGISFVDVQMIPSSNLSSECCDLLNKCKSNSMTLDELLEHEWFRKS
ncbi:hypothetical protein Q8A67_008160 [Cirrhinus molitorella]|uniref:Uncharacterized protein n=1 Tax=Cirrhinus molitorella TaxID=172907 RepID=A0AA88U0Z3_9TELE|nr:hypothetical protein Q8A67_008160 [Cirrhinus molitorella]